VTGQTLSVRLASAADREALARLRVEWTTENGNFVLDPTFDERFSAWFSQDRSPRIVWIAEVGDTVVGMLNMVVFHRMPQPGMRAQAWGYIANVYVEADSRNQGVGGVLLKEATAYARAEGFIRLVLNPSDRSTPFYARAGFRPATELMLLALSDAKGASQQLTFQPFTEADLPALNGWLNEPHVDRWWHEAENLAGTRARYLPDIEGREPCFPLLIQANGHPVGFAQWYWWRDYPHYQQQIGATDGEVGIDYLLGDAALCGRGLGTTLVAELVRYVSDLVPDADGIVVDPEVANRASCRVLEKNGFRLVTVTRVEDPDSPPVGPSAVYRHELSPTDELKSSDL
jgi:RimJ/RimL family protein N-acetyltransferase